MPKETSIPNGSFSCGTLVSCQFFLPVPATKAWRRPALDTDTGVLVALILVTDFHFLLNLIDVWRSLKTTMRQIHLDSEAWKHRRRTDKLIASKKSRELRYNHVLGMSPAKKTFVFPRNHEAALEAAEGHRLKCSCGKNYGSC